MGILRADRITGLGGANAITGSVSFAHDGDVSAGESGALQVQNKNDALTFGTGDWTVEFWFYANRLGVVQSFYDGRGTGAGSNTAVYIRLSDANKIQFFTTNAFRITGSTTIIANAWYHVALTRTGSTHTLYVNGSSDGTYSNSGMDYTGPTNNFAVIGSDDNRDGRYGLNGYISNLRVAKELIYSAAFSVPTTALAPTSNTTLLCCQSPGNVNASFGDTTLTAFASNTNSKGPQASRFTPNSPVGFSTTTDVGSQYGTTFDGFGSFATSTYMVPPAGNTRERNRGRGLVMAGSIPSGASTGIESIEVQSSGNGVDFGSLSATRYNAGAASATRGLSMGGKAPSVNTIEFVTIANSSNSTDFGDLTLDRRYVSPVSNDTRAVAMGGYNQSPVGYNNIMDFVTIATAGNATDFGDTTNTVTNGAPVNSTTRGLMCGGANPSAQENVIQFITIASTGNAQDFGDLTLARRGMSSVSSSTRGVLSGGYTGSSPNTTNVMDYVTIASAGNATDFGDSTVAVALKPVGQICSRTRGVFVAGGYPSQGNVIDFATIATTGNASDFGDLLVPILDSAGACSDSHGGLS